MKSCSSIKCLLMLLLTPPLMVASEVADLTGIALDDKDKPVTEANVVLIYKSWPGGRYRQQARSAKTDDEGKFAFESLYSTGEKTAFLVTIVKSGYALQSEYVINRDGNKLSPFEFKMTSVKKLTLQIMDKDGEPLKDAATFPAKRSTKDGVEYFIYQQSGTQLASRTDADGKVDMSFFQIGDASEVYVANETGWSKVSFKVGDAPEQAVTVGTSEPTSPVTKRWTPDARQVDTAQIEWIQKNAIPLKSIDPNDQDFTDLAPLKTLIGDARIVQLGEQSHGDGTCFETKIRLIKFLHQKMGFDVLAFESGLFDCRKTWQAFERGEPALEAAPLGVFGIWTGSRQVQPLFEYLAANANGDHPLELCGFDCQFTAAGSRRHLVQDLRRLVDNLEFESPSSNELEKLYKQLEELLDYEKDVSGIQKEFMSMLDALGKALSKEKPSDRGQAREVQFWIQNLKSIQTHAKTKWTRRAAPNINIRDEQMAKNLIWLANDFYKDRKIIVWAASFHILRNPAEIEVPDQSVNYKDTVPMGHHIAEQFGDEVFTVGFTAYEGAAGAFFRPPFPIGKAPDGTLEGICNAAELENAVIPLRSLDKDGQWLNEKQFARPLGYSWMQASWPRHFDAMLFNRTMLPSLRVGTR